jgi:DNA primase
MCSDDSNHGGFNIEKSNYNCHICGSHKLTLVLKQLTTLNDFQIRNLIKKYQFKGPAGITISQYQSHHEESSISCSLPSNAGPLKSIHKQYLLKRKFDPDKLERIWNLKGTDHNGDYKFRIIAPIYDTNNVLISYQGRDITDQSDIRYKACAKKNEVLHHKHSLYGINKVKSKSIIVVEGITDVWRLGPGSVATFGTGFTNHQVLLLSEFKKVYILFDNTLEAAQHSLLLKNQLTGLGIFSKVFGHTFGIKDPAELTNQQAKEIMEMLK